MEVKCRPLLFLTACVRDSLIELYAAFCCGCLQQLLIKATFIAYASGVFEHTGVVTVIINFILWSALHMKDI